MTFEHEGAGVDDFASVCVKVARDTGSVVGNQRRAFDPTNRGPSEVLCFGEENSKVSNPGVELVNPGREGVLGSARELLDGRVVRGESESLNCGRPFLMAQEGPVQDRISVTNSLTWSRSPSRRGATTLEGNWDGIKACWSRAICSDDRFVPVRAAKAANQAE